MKIGVIGAGYVGLVTGICLAELGFEIFMVDLDATKINKLQNNDIPIYEPGLKELYLTQVKNKRLHFFDHYEAFSSIDTFIIAVGTPTDEKDGSVNLSFIKNAITQLYPHLSDNAMIIVKSTVPPGTSKVLADLIRKGKPELKFHMVSNPEFLREGSAIQDFFAADRIVIGSESKYAKNKMQEINEFFIKKNVPILWTDIATAELIKYVSNCYLATKVAYINEMANICEQIGGNIEDLIQGIGLDHRIGKQFLKPGPGFGGSCFPKDIQAFTRFAHENKVGSNIIDAVIQSNTNRKSFMANKIERACGGSLHEKTIGILGVTFKANTDDVRESPAIAVIQELLQKNANIKIFDPLGMENAKGILKSDKITWCNESYEAIENSNALVIATEWEEFRILNPDKIKDLMHSPIVLDFRNILDAKAYKKTGFQFQNIG